MRRGVAIFVVLLVVAAGASVAVAVLSQGSAARRSAELADDRVQSRSAAWSAVQVLMSRIHDQHEDLLAGGQVEVPGVIELWGGTGAGRVVALVEGTGVQGPAADPIAAPHLPESAKLPLNRADAAMLIKAGLKEDAANAVMARRRGRPFGSVEELATVPGVSVSQLFEGAASPDAAPAPSTTTSNDAPGKVSALVERLTVQSYEPASRMLAWGEGSPGDPRVDARQKLPATFVQELEREIGKAVADRLVKSMGAGRGGLTRSKFVGLMKTQGVPKASWGKVLDAVTFGDDAFVSGLVDINTAPADVLACLPGLTPESAAGIVKGREGTDADKRRSITWPLEAGIVTEEEFVAAADWLSTRSLQWRYRLTVGEAAGEGPEQGVRPRGKLVVDVVIDAADGRPRLAYYREVTYLPLALAMEREVSAAAAKLEADRQRLAPPPPPPPPQPTASSSASPPAPPARPVRTTQRPKQGNRGANDAAKGEDEPAKDAGALKDRRQGRWRTDGSGS